MIRELERVILNRDLPDTPLRQGDVGTVVLVHRDGAAFEVEFMTLDGETVEIVTLLKDDVRPVGPGEMSHARPLQITA